jgi:hypothetical protein
MEVSQSVWPNECESNVDGLLFHTNRWVHRASKRPCVCVCVKQHSHRLETRGITPLVSFGQACSFLNFKRGIDLCAGALRWVWWSTSR